MSGGGAAAARSAAIDAAAASIQRRASMSARSVSRRTPDASKRTWAMTSRPLAVRQSATRIASPWRTSTSRSCSSRLMASRTVVAFSPYSRASVRCEGSFSPAA